jgi:hypothetical protein
MVKLELDMVNHPFLHPFSGIQPGFSIFFRQTNATKLTANSPILLVDGFSHHLRRFERHGLQQQLLCGSPGGFWSKTRKAQQSYKKMLFFSGKIIYKWRFSCETHL